jgi:hypothetical protein
LKRIALRRQRAKRLCPEPCINDSLSSFRLLALDHLGAVLSGGAFSLSESKRETRKRSERRQQQRKKEKKVEPEGKGQQRQRKSTLNAAIK